MFHNVIFIAVLMLSIIAAQSLYIEDVDDSKKLNDGTFGNIKVSMASNPSTDKIGRLEQFPQPQKKLHYSIGQRKYRKWNHSLIKFSKLISEFMRFIWFRYIFINRWSFGCDGSQKFKLANSPQCQFTFFISTTASAIWFYDNLRWDFSESGEWISFKLSG